MRDDKESRYDEKRQYARPNKPHNRGHRRLNLSAPSQKPKLLDQVRLAICTRHYSPKTEESYVHWIKRFIFFQSKRRPAEMGEKEIAQFLSSLASGFGVNASTQN